VLLRSASVSFSVLNTTSPPVLPSHSVFNFGADSFRAHCFVFFIPSEISPRCLHLFRLELRRRSSVKVFPLFAMGLFLQCVAGSQTLSA